jgi:sulfate adenylyltransferase large subunit
MSTPKSSDTETSTPIVPTTGSMDLLRFATAGSVDDGKSTLIGRLLLDSKSIFEDQLEAVEATSQNKGYDYTDLALLTDGLRSEREQGITIDVAYRYFATPSRKFIIADTPGHTQYTRNMVTGASTADLGLVLVDARQGLTEQSRRHAVLLSLLRVPHLVLAVNKMDLVDYSQETYEAIHSEFTQFATKLNIPDLEVIPISALQGDNVVNRSENMPWYAGSTLMHHLEHIHVASDRDLLDVRFPVQFVVRPKSDDYHDYRGYAGQVAGGVLKPGDEVVVLPSGMTSTIEGIDLFDQEIGEAFPPMSVTVRLTDDVDVSRGDMIARVKNAPKPSQDIDAMICWMTNEPMRPRQKLAIKHTTRSGRALVKDIQYRLDVNTLHRDMDSKELGLNEIGRVQLRTTVPLLCDPYAKNRTTGSFILVDEATGVTVGAGMINSGS